MRSLGDRNRRATEGHNITTTDFKEHFQKVSQGRYERGAEEIEEAAK